MDEVRICVGMAGTTLATLLLLLAQIGPDAMPLATQTGAAAAAVR